MVLSVPQLLWVGVSRSPRVWAVKPIIILLVVAAVAYLAIIGAMYATQTRLLFPTHMATAPGVPLPAGAVRLVVAAGDGKRLHGVRVPPARAGGDAPPIVLGFGGNAWHADALALDLRVWFPDAEIVAFHYRGYGPNEGEPSAAALLADALIVHDHVRASAGDRPLVAVGFSIGSAVAAHLARRRPLAGVVLVSPFDTLAALARHHYPWAPVRWLLRHEMATIDDVAGVTAPVALVAAAGDRLVPPPRTEAVRRDIPNLVLDRTIAGTDHIDLYGHPEFAAAMGEALAHFEAAWRAAGERPPAK